MGQHTRATRQAPVVEPSALSPILQRCGGVRCPPGMSNHDGEEPTLQRHATEAAQGVAPPIVHDVLRSPGRPLDAETQASLGPAFGRDFSHIRVHTDSRAASSAQAVQAHAYTVGQHVVFAAGRYQPATSTGQRLLAHELAHTVQQPPTSAPAGRLLVSNPGDPGDVEADRAADAVSAGEAAAPALAARTQPVALQRDYDGTPPSGNAESGAGGGAVGAPAGPVQIAGCRPVAANTWLKDPVRSGELPGLTVFDTSSQVTPPQLQVEPADGGRVRVKATTAALGPIETQFLGVGQYPIHNEDGTPLVYRQQVGPKLQAYPVVLDVDGAGSNLIRQGEEEHCHDWVLVFLLTLGGVANAINQLALGSRTFANRAEALRALSVSVKIRPEQWMDYFRCLGRMATDERDRKRTPDGGWHTLRPPRPNPDKTGIRPGNGIIGYRMAPDSRTGTMTAFQKVIAPEINQHPSIDVLQSVAAKCKPK